MILKGKKIRLELTNKQVTMALQHAGVARHAYNWGLGICQKAFENKEKRPTAIDLHKKLVAEVKKEHKWYYNSSKCAPQQALKNLEISYKNFYVSPSNGLPKFKKRGVNDSFYLEQNIRVEQSRIRVPIFGWLKCSELLPNVEVKSVVISRKANEWFISFKMPHEKIITEKTKGIVGVDLGIKILATLSDGTIFPAIRPYKKYKRKLKILQRQASKKFVNGAKEQSNNYKKACKKVAVLHQQISNERLNYTHKLTTYLAKNHSEIVVENLNVKGMSKNHKLASAILDGGFYEFKRQLEYKCEWYGSTMTTVSRFYPSSKTCSNCSAKKESLKLSERTFHCEYCNISIDRDLNASINLRNMAVSATVKQACGEVQTIGIAPTISMKQEINNKINFV